MYSVIKKGIFSYKDGKITYQGERYFDSGIITYYLIEYGLQRLQGAKDILYDVSFNFGKKIGLDKNKEHIVNYLSALGWGDILFALKTDEEFVHIDYFPWCPLESEIEQYSLIAGLVSGLMSSLLKKDIRLKNTIKATNTIQNKFSLTIK
jgi:hypothetical protein